MSELGGYEPGEPFGRGDPQPSSSPEPLDLHFLNTPGQVSLEAEEASIMDEDAGNDDVSWGTWAFCTYPTAPAD
jgi:hypothetical protein